jgi:hypothetical protein
MGHIHRAAHGVFPGQVLAVDQACPDIFEPPHLRMELQPCGVCLTPPRIPPRPWTVDWPARRRGGDAARAVSAWISLGHESRPTPARGTTRLLRAARVWGENTSRARRNLQLVRQPQQKITPKRSRESRLRPRLHDRYGRHSKPDVSPAPRRMISGSGWEKSITVVGSVPHSPESITAPSPGSSARPGRAAAGCSRRVARRARRAAPGVPRAAGFALRRSFSSGAARCAAPPWSRAG